MLYASHDVASGVRRREEPDDEAKTKKNNSGDGGGGESVVLERIDAGVEIGQREK